MHEILRLFGWDNATSGGYLFWSGSGGLIVVWVASVLLIWWHRSCNRAWWCPFIGDHAFTDPQDGISRRLCFFHHPDVKSKYLTRQRMAEIQHRRHLRRGKKPGSG